MDGDFTLLEDLLAIPDRHDAFLVVDEAHATGVYGEQGEGSQRPMKDAQISWLFIPAARRWELPARLLPLLACCATS